MLLRLFVKLVFEVNVVDYIVDGCFNLTLLFATLLVLLFHRFSKDFGHLGRMQMEHVGPGQIQETLR